MPSRLTSRLPLLALLATSIAAAGALLWQTADWARHVALGDIRERSTRTLELIVENLTGELARYGIMPDVLSSHPSIVRALSSPDEPALAAALNVELERINAASGALDTYVMNRDGLTIAASNWSTERPFVGNNFSYRPYFQIAMQGRLGRYFALGTTSGERGYFFAYPVRSGEQILGAVVVKMDVARLEASWRSADSEIIVVDEEGVVFLSSRADWRLRAMEPLSPEASARLVEQRRYPEGALAPLTLTRLEADGHEFLELPAEGDRPGTPATYMFLSHPMPEAGWSVAILADTAPVPRHVNDALAVVGFMLATIVFAATNIYQRRRRLSDRLAYQEAARADLERKVRERTQDLVEANESLRVEIGERQRAEAELRRTQDDLIQASKLAALGQMAGGLSHELNQPLAAIRAYAGNARAFLDRGEPAKVDGNLAGIAELTERMARIIRNLRTYARKEPIATRPTPLAPAITEALALLDSRIAEEGVEVILDLPALPLVVVGGDVRLQQIFVNLVGNALDAMRGQPRRQLTVAAHEEADCVVATVRDTGPGIAEQDLARVFDPFFSTKEVGDGMGLGLSITYGIVQQLGGAITVANAVGGGALLTLRLRRALPQLEVAE